ncbi:MAG: glycerophosphoryl diester phosphodiesterase membrane domain-containing protein [Turicibacter sp.]|nr:glycerophosphoryl diester phosphodiesterase membrane domain-containing protein [Turicibacter sp.]
MAKHIINHNVNEGGIDIFHLFKQTATLINYNGRTLLLFELFHKLFALSFLIPTFFKILTHLMKKENLTYLTPSIIYRFILSPSTLLTSLFLLLCLSYYFFLEVQALFILFQASYWQQKISILKLLQHSLRQSLRIFLPQNMFLLFFLISFLPLSTWVFKSIFLDGTTLTELLFDFIYQRISLHPMYFVFILFIQLLGLRLTFTLPIFLYHKCSWLTAIKESFLLTKQKSRYLLPLLMNGSLFLVILLMMSYGLLIFSAALISKMIVSSTQAPMIFLTVSLTIKSMLTMLMPSFLMISLYAFTISIYVYSSHTIPKLSLTTGTTRYPLLSFVAILILSLLTSELLTPVNLYLNTQHLSDEIQMIAHRASAAHAPENTLAALDYAILMGAQIAEIDVQLTKDGEIILMHDANLKRTTGFDQRVSESTYSTIQSLEAGSHFSEAFTGEPIPTLEEVLQQSKGQISLIIEIKEKEHPVQAVQKIIQLIEEYEMEEECLIGSMDYHVLQTVKRMNPTLQTVYITAIAYGDYQNLQDVDYYSIEASFISIALVDQIHRSGKQIYAWTVNKESTMQSMISMQVDGIVTDDPLLLKHQLTHIHDPYISLIYNYFF